MSQNTNSAAGTPIGVQDPHASVDASDNTQLLVPGNDEPEQKTGEDKSNMAWDSSKTGGVPFMMQGAKKKRSNKTVAP